MLLRMQLLMFLVVVSMVAMAQAADTLRDCRKSCMANEKLCLFKAAKWLQFYALYAESCVIDEKRCIVGCSNASQKDIFNEVLQDGGKTIEKKR